MGAALQAGLPDEDRDAVSGELGTLAMELGGEELVRARQLVGEIAAAVAHDQQSQKARAASAALKLNAL